MITLPTIESETIGVKKDDRPAEISRAIATANIRRYQNSKHIYTDGSKSERGVGAAGIVDNTVRKSTLQATASILTSELHAINLALYYRGKHKCTPCNIYRLAMCSEWSESV